MQHRYFILIFFHLTFGIQAQLFINEIQAANHTTITDEDGDYEDWIELYNNSSIAVNVGGWYLSDKDHTPKMWSLPDTTIPAKGFLLIWASGKDRKKGHLHTNFRISSEGEPILLTSSEGITFNRLPPVKLQPNESYGRVPDGGHQLETFHTATPGSTNAIDGTAPVLVSLMFDQPQGYQAEDFTVNIISTRKAQIHYTLDGSTPTPTSPIFNESIEVTSLEGTPNVYADIPSGHSSRFWKKPMGEVPKIRVIRARPFVENKAVGPEIQGSFWTGHHNPENLDIPIVSFMIHPDHFFDYKEGIYVPGIDYDSLEIPNSWRRGRQTEKPANFSYFDENGELALQQNIGVRINGGGTRNAGQKSLRLYARNEYGPNTFNYPFFEERSNHHYRRLLLNTTQGDYSFTLFKDELTTNIVKPLDLEYQAFRPVLVFLNGEYWALHFLKERRDQHYIAALIDDKPDNINQLYRYNAASHGSNDHYLRFLNELGSMEANDPGIVDMMEKYIEVDNYIDYQIVQIFLANYDWPHNNIDWWRTNDANSRWRWIFYDLDASFRKYALDNVTTYFRAHDPEQDRPEWSYVTMRKLMANPQFRKRFHDRFYQLMQGVLSTENLLAEIEKMRALIEPYVDDYVYRWRIPSSVTEWKENVRSLETFAQLRPHEIHNMLKRNMRKPFNMYPNPGEHIIHLQWATHPGTEIDVKVFDMSGRSIHVPINNKTFEDVPAITLNVANLQSGVYIIRVRMGQFYFNEKWIKK
ncbi:MAG: CotH kinase family protein [Cryomorphaceae bacterium]|nr:CotH kinase family protein [Cryomorphaceae bacterium]